MVSARERLQGVLVRFLRPICFQPCAISFVSRKYRSGMPLLANSLTISSFDAYHLAVAALTTPAASPALL